MLKDTDFLFASSRIRAAEGKGTARERLNRLREVRDRDELAAAVAEWTGADPALPLSALLEEALTEAAALVSTSVPDARDFRFLFLKYDCNNLKTALKAALQHAPADEALFYRFGAVPGLRAAEAVAAGDYTAVTPHLAEAAVRAAEAYRASGEGRVIDLLLDRACFEDLLDETARLGVPLFQRYVSLRADSVNLLASRRILSSGMPEAAALSLLTRAFVPGGSLALSDLTAEGAVLPLEEVLCRIGEPSLREAVSAIVDGKLSPAAAEHRLDDVTDTLLAGEHARVFGPEIPALFFWMRESEVRNARLMATGLGSEAGRSAAAERMRGLYA